MICKALFISILITALLPWAPSANAQKKQGSPKWTAEEEGCLLLAGLAKKEYLIYWSDDTGLYVRVEPLFWKKAMHREKVQLVQAAMHTARFLNKQTGSKIRSVMFFDMTSHDELAYGSIGPISPGKIEILK